MKRAFAFLSLLLLLSLPVSMLAQKDKEKDSDKIDESALKGMQDVNAIGNRNVGCGRGLGNWYSVDKQVQMGRQYAQQVESSSKMITDPVINEYVNRLGQNLVKNSDSQVPFTIKVIDSDVVNAFALPGGFFFVNSGLILNADYEAELAGVMSHEIAHVAACHAAREMTRGNIANIASLPLIFIGGGLGTYALEQAGMGLGLPVTFMKFSRNFEAQADYLGTQYMYRAGYDPRGMTDMFEKLAAMEKRKPGFFAKAFDSHPQTPDRVEHTQQEIASILPPKDQYMLDTSEFQSIKARLAAIENKRKPRDGDKDERPELRRTSAPNGSDSAPSDRGGDGPPVLKRPPSGGQ
jgi:predicted Zn-dependent protease